MTYVDAGYWEWGYATTDPLPVSRRPIQIVEIDLPKCARTYGTLPCTAVLGTTGTRKCYNTRATCQSPTGYLGSQTLTLRFGQNQSGLPQSATIFPALRAVSTRAGSINLSGFDPKTTALGKRARVTVTLQDFAYHDTLTDPYQSQRVSGAAQSDGIGYDPSSRGTFFARMRSRWPYYLGKSLRVLEGYEGDTFAQMRTRHYVISEWEGPNAAGVVTITAKDVLDLADNDKAQAPRASRGKLKGALTETATSATLTPSGVGAEYAASGLLVIGKELARFTRSGDVLTLTRGAEGTTAVTHNAGDLVQECAEYVKQRADTIIADLLTTYAGVSASFIDATAWQAEIERWLGGILFSAIITKPEGVATLIGEICQHGVMTWWGEVAQKIGLVANRPLDLDETFVPVTDADQIIAGTADREDTVEARASQVWFWHGVLDPTQSVTDDKNFRSLAIAADLEMEGDDRYGENRVKVIYSRWFGSTGDDANAAIIADRLLARYRETPITLTCTLDVKDLAAVPLATTLSVKSAIITDETGAVVPYTMQVQSVEETDPGNRVRIEAQTFTFTGRFGWIMLDTAPDYDAASATQKAEGFFIVDDALLAFPDGTGPYELF